MYMQHTVQDPALQGFMTEMLSAAVPAALVQLDD